VSFAVVGKTERGGSERLTVVPGAEGRFWLALSGRGLASVTEGGKTVEMITGVRTCNAVGVGKAAPDAGQETLFIWGQAGDGSTGLHRSTDRGASWVRVNNDDHEFGGLGNAGFVVGDANVFGRVYHSTAGRGVAVGEPKAATKPATARVAE
jgi:hypothetical protein